MAPRLVQRLWHHFSPAQRTLLLVNLASITEKADEALLPAVFQEVSQVFHSSPSALGTLTFIRGLVQAATSPLAAYLAQRHNRCHIIGLGAIWWGIATAAVGLSSTYWQLALARAINGVGLAVVLPAIQSVVADASSTEERGAGFGWLQLTSNSGAIVGGVFATLLAGTALGPIAGWRLAFFVLAIISVVLGAAVYAFAVDPRDVNRYSTIRAQLDDDDADVARPPADVSVKASLKELWVGAKTVVSLRTFQIIIAQGTIGSFPWNAMVFYTLWLELVGYSHGAAAALVASFSVGTCFGGLFGGYLGDFAASRLPDTGRILCSQFSSGVAVPLALLLLHLIPRDPALWYAHGGTLFTMGLLISWNAPATNNPIFAEIVPDHLRTAIYAFDRAFETVISAFGSPAVGFVAERLYGYITDDPADLSGPSAAAERASNARSLANGLFTTIAIPFSICCLTYTLLYFTYPKDRDKARAQAAEEAPVEMEMSFPHGDDGGVREQTRLLPEEDGLEGSPAVMRMADGEPGELKPVVGNGLAWHGDGEIEEGVARSGEVTRYGHDRLQGPT